MIISIVNAQVLEILFYSLKLNILFQSKIECVMPSEYFNMYIQEEWVQNIQMIQV